VTALPIARVNARGAARLRGGHPWIYRADVSAAPEGEEVVQVADERGRPIGSALAAPAPAPIALRVYARGAVHVPFDDELLRARLRAAVARRADLCAGAEALRLVHGEADLIPGLFVDRYRDAAVVQSATGAIDRREERIARLLHEELGLRLVVARDDGSARDHEGLPRRRGLLHGAGPTRVEVREGAARFTCDLLEDAKTGSFLDQRDNHLRVGALARGEALDAFTYHGGFALAMAGRAERVLALDEDARAVAQARANAEASGLGNVEIRAADAFVALRELEQAGRVFDVVVLDPPALAKRRGVVDDGLRAYRELNLRGLRLCRPGGLLVTCSCSGKVTPERFGTMLAEAARDAHRDAVILERRGAGPDHPVLVGVPETEYLKCFLLRVL
jgi:23S rRNA (cytosine1962-C5)-methyltransferase